VKLFRWNFIFQLNLVELIQEIATVIEADSKLLDDVIEGNFDE